MCVHGNQSISFHSYPWIFMDVHSESNLLLFRFEMPFLIQAIQISSYSIIFDDLMHGLIEMGLGWMIPICCATNFARNMSGLFS